MGLRPPALTVVGVVVTTIARAISEWTPGGLSPATVRADAAH